MFALTPVRPWQASQRCPGPGHQGVRRSQVATVFVQPPADPEVLSNDTGLKASEETFCLAAMASAHN